jgi:hypothetical protein
MGDLSREETTQFCAVCRGCICFRVRILPLLELSTKIIQTDEGFHLSFLLFGVQSLVYDTSFISLPQSLCHSRKCDKNVLNPVLHVIKRNYAANIKDYSSCT